MPSLLIVHPVILEELKQTEKHTNRIALCTSDKIPVIAVLK